MSKTINVCQRCYRASRELPAAERLVKANDPKGNLNGVWCLTCLRGEIASEFFQEAVTALAADASLTGEQKAAKSITALYDARRIAAEAFNLALGLIAPDDATVQQTATSQFVQAQPNT